MIVTSGRVVNGKVVVEGTALREGEVVTVLVREPDTPFELTPEQEAFLANSVDQIRRGEFISGTELLGRITPR